MKNTEELAWRRFSRAFIWHRTYPLLFDGLQLHEVDEARVLSRVLVKAMQNCGIVLEVVPDLNEEAVILPNGTEFTPDGIVDKARRKIKVVRSDNLGLLVHEFAHLLDLRRYSANSQKDIAACELRASLVEYIVVCRLLGLSSPNEYVNYAKENGANKRTLLLCSKREIFKFCDKITSFV